MSNPKVVALKKKRVLRVSSGVDVGGNGAAKPMKAISLFSGMGGDTLGLKMAGVDVVAYNEFDKTAVTSHEANFPGCVLLKAPGDSGSCDIMKIEDDVFTAYRGVVDLIFAGFPCQGFSHGGKKLPEDPRNTLFREFVRVTACVRPRFIIGENVDGLLSRKTADGRNFIDVIVEAFAEIGYSLKWKVCHAAKHGVPQLRKRLIIVGIRDEDDGSKTIDKFTFPPEDVLAPGLRDIIKYDLTGCARVTDEQFDFATIDDPSCVMRDMDDFTEPEGGKDVHPYVRMKLDTDIASLFGYGEESVEVDTQRKKEKKRFTSLLSFGKRESPFHLEVVDVRNPSKTIICTYDHQPRLLVPVENATGRYVRTMLPDELKQIQGFPADFVVCGNTKQKIKQIGNAVPPPLIAAITRQILAVAAM